MRQSGQQPKRGPSRGYLSYARVRDGELTASPARTDRASLRPTPVTGLDLSGAGLSVLRLSSSYAHLTELYLQKNSLRQLPTGLGMLSRLRVLDLSYNSLSTITPELGLLYELRELNLSCNRLEDLPLEVFGRLCRLEICKLEGNNIVSPPLQVLQAGGRALFRYCCDNMSLPNPPDRSMIHLISEPEQLQLQAAGRIKLTMVCYNILAELYATAERHPYCPTWALAWSYRKMRILSELIYLDADLICLQEVETAQYHDFFLPNMAQGGYEGIFQPKSRARTMGNGARVDGCAIFWKHSKFGLVEEHVMEFQNEASQRMEEFAGEGLNRLILKDNIALLALLEIWSTRQRVLVANTHIHWDPQFSDVKLVQTKMFLEKLSSLREQHAQLPVIVSGDFNSTPDSGVFELVTAGRLDAQHPELRSHSYGDYSVAGMNHDLNLVSCYPASTRYTNCTHEFQGTLDYIFVTRDSLQVAAILAPVPMDQLPLPALPNAFYPSDHVALMAHLFLSV